MADWRHLVNIDHKKVVIDTNHPVNHILITAPGYELWRGKTIHDAFNKLLKDKGRRCVIT